MVDEGKVAKSQKPRAVWELEEDSQSDFAFQVFCFFEDLHALQGELRRTWTEYKNGSVDLLAATIITTAAIELVGTAEKEIHLTHPGVLDYTRSYQDPALTIFYSESLRRGEDPEVHLDSKAGQDLEITPFKEFMYLPTGRTLMKIAQMKHVFKVAHHVAIPPMRFNYIARPDLFLGADEARMERFEAEEKVICQLIQDLLFKDFIKRHAKRGRSIHNTPV